MCVCVCVYSYLTYPACKAHMPHHIFSCSLYVSTPSFPHYLINTTIFERKKKLLNTKCLFWLSLQILYETFPFLRSKGDTIKGAYWSSSKVPFFLPDFNESWVSSIYFRKIFKHRISWKSVQWGPSWFMRTDRQTDVHDEANSRFSQFC